MTSKRPNIIKIACYSAEKYDKFGDGRIGVEFCCKNMTPQEIEEKKKEIKQQFKDINRDYRYQITSAGKRSDNQIIGNKDFVLRDKKHLHEVGTLISKKPIMINANKLPDFVKFDKDTGNSIVQIGSSKSGKTTMLRALAIKYFLDKKQITTLFSVNCHIKLYKLPRLIRCCKFNDECATLIKKAKFLNYKTKNKYDFTFLFDDIIHIKYSSLVSDLINVLRNSRISSLISVQYPYMLAKNTRNSINNLFFFSLNTDECIKTVLDSFLKSHFNKIGVIGEANQIDYYRSCTKDHAFIYLHPSSGEIKIYKLSL